MEMFTWSPHMTLGQLTEVMRARRLRMDPEQRKRIEERLRHAREVEKTVKEAREARSRRKTAPYWDNLLRPKKGMDKRG